MATVTTRYGGTTVTAKVTAVHISSTALAPNTILLHALRDLGYRVSSKPVVFSPHLLPPERGGRPQVRERVFILGTFVGRKAAQGDPAFRAR